MASKKKLTKAKREELENSAVTKLVAKPSVVQSVLYHQLSDAFIGENHSVEQWELRELLDEQSNAIANGDTEKLNQLLASQVLSLNALFAKYGGMAVRAEYISNMEAYAKIALRAQAQCRATAEAISAIQNPPHATFVKQTNISNGAPQQVNNGQQQSLEQMPSDTLGREIDVTAKEALPRG